VAATAIPSTAGTRCRTPRRCRGSATRSSTSSRNQNRLVRFPGRRYRIGTPPGRHNRNRR
jgi:hypothetical protein